MIHSAVLTDIERQLDQLSQNEQLWLIERLAQAVRRNAQNDHEAFQLDLAVMAADPEIQREIKQIEEEFSLT